MPKTTSMDAALFVYQPWRESLLTQQQRAMLAGTPDAALVQKGLQDLYQPAVQARLSDRASDPRGLWTQGAASPGLRIQAAPRDGQPGVRSHGLAWA